MNEFRLFCLSIIIIIIIILNLIPKFKQIGGEKPRRKREMDSKSIAQLNIVIFSKLNLMQSYV